MKGRIMNKRLHEYVNEIFDIAATNKVGMGVAKDMFLANIGNNGDHELLHYPGAKMTNYFAFKPHLKELEDGQTTYTEAVWRNYEKRCHLHTEGRRDQVKKLVGE